MSSLVPIKAWHSPSTVVFKDIKDLKQTMEEFKPHPLNKIYDHIKKYGKDITLKDVFHNKHIRISPGNGKFMAPHMYGLKKLNIRRVYTHENMDTPYMYTAPLCEYEKMDTPYMYTAPLYEREKMDTPYDCHIVKSIDAIGKHETRFEIIGSAPLLYSRLGLFCPEVIIDTPLHNWWHNSREIKYSLSQLFEILSRQDLIDLVLTIFFGTDKRDIVEEFLPNFDYKTAIYNYLKDTKRYFISALVDESSADNEKKYFYTSCCQTKIRDHLFELMIEDSKGCPFCKTKYSLCDNGYIVYDLEDLDFKCCTICGEFNAVGFVINPEDESKIYQCNHHSIEDLEKRRYKDTGFKRTNGKYSVNKYPDSYVFGLLSVFKYCREILIHCTSQEDSCCE